jgi:hypothetical protein
VRSGRLAPAARADGGEPGGGELVDHHFAHVVGCLGALLAVVRHCDHHLCGRMTTIVAAT